MKQRWKGEGQVSSGDKVELNCETPSFTQHFNRHLNQRSLLDLKGQEEKMEMERRQNVQLIKFLLKWLFSLFDFLSFDSFSSETQ